MRFHLHNAALLLALAGWTQAQQICHATKHASEPINTNTIATRYLTAMRMVAPRNMIVVGLEVITGLRAGTGTLSIWSHDAVGDNPLKNISGDGTYQQRKLISWHSASLPTLAILNKDQVFWLCWLPGASGSRTPWSDAKLGSAGTVPYVWSPNGGVTWNRPGAGQHYGPGRYMFRLHCAYQTGTYTRVLPAQAGLGGIKPEIVMDGWPSLKNEIVMALDKAAPGVPAILAIGLPKTTHIGIGTLHVSPLVELLFLTTPDRMNTPGTGQALLSAPIPNDPNLVGFPIAVQWWTADKGAATGFAHTEGRILSVR